MLKRLFAAFLVPAILIALPVFLRPENEPGSGKSVDTLVIVTAHTESIKYEFEHAFRRYYRAKTGRDIRIDWRSIGGTSDISRYIDAQFTANFRLAWLAAGNSYREKEEGSDFKNARKQSPARDFFLKSDIGIGIDIFFGGGTYEHSTFAAKGFAVDAGVKERHPEYFDPAVIPAEYAGETIYDAQGRFYGCCLSSFGISVNPDRFRDAGLPLPQTWNDLARPELFQRIALADPTKSGSIMKCYEMILQQAMLESGPEKGWLEGFRRIKLIASNARYATDSAGKLVRDVSSGAAAAGMSIDFYSFSEAKWTQRVTGEPRVVYIMPHSQSAVSCDPIQMLRGAPNAEAAKLFIDFNLSPEGQRLWIQEPGTPGGPEKYALLRSGVRRDLPKTVPRAYLSNPDYDPYTAAGGFRYHAEWTGKYFTLIRVLIKCLALDPMDDLREARRAVLANGGDEANPEALDMIAEMPFSFRQADETAKRLSGGTAAEAAKLRREWTDFAVRQYRAAAKSASEKGAAR